MSRLSVCLALATTFAFLGCQKKEESAPMGEAMPSSPSEQSYKESAELAAPGSPVDGGGASGVPAPQFVRSADMRFRCRSVSQTTSRIESIVSANGGYVALTDLRGYVAESHEQSFGTDSLLEITRVDVSNNLELRVPNEQLDTVLAQITPLVAFLDHRTVRAQDVGQELRRASRERRRMDRATRRMEDLGQDASGRLKDRALVDDQALQREDRAESAADRIDDLEGQVRLSTIQVSIYQHPETRLDTLERPLHQIWQEPFFKRLARSWMEGWSGFLSFALWIVAHWVLLVIVAGVGFSVFRWRRRKAAPAA